MAFSCSMITQGACMGPAVAAAGAVENLPVGLRRQPVSPAVAGCTQHQARQWTGQEQLLAGLQRKLVALLATGERSNREGSPGTWQEHVKKH